MIPSVSSNVLVVTFPWRNLAFSSSPAYSTLRFGFSPISQTKLFSSIDAAKEVEQESFTVSYLINSCGFSSESAKLISKHVQYKEDSSNLDSVLHYLINYGFSDAQIMKIVKMLPQVLLLSPEKILKPKMEFFLSIGVKAEDLLTIICRDPMLFGCSLNKRIIPCYDFLKRLLVHDELVVKSLKNSSWIWKMSLETNVVPNLELLKKVGVPESNIQHFLVRASVLLGIGNAKFSERVNGVISMGFEPSKYSFVEAIIRWPSKSIWESKARLCSSWGWSGSDMTIAFRKNPLFIHTSVEKLTAVMDFLVNKMGWDPSAVADSSYLLSYSLEKNIIPKFSVVRVLMLKGLIGEDIRFLTLPKKKFMDKYVFSYLERVPELLDIFEGNVDLEELGYGFEEKLDTKQNISL